MTAKPSLKVRLRLSCDILQVLTICAGQLDTLRHLRKDVTEAGKGMECGMSIAGFGDLKEGDLIQVIEKIEKPGIL